MRIIIICKYLLTNVTLQQLLATRTLTESGETRYVAAEHNK